MHTRRLRTRGLLVLAAASLLISIVLLLKFFGQSDISRTAFDRIQLGMTEQEVSEVLGRLPNRPFADGDYLSDTEKMYGEDLRPSTPHKIWWGRDHGAKIFFDKEGKVVGARYDNIKNRDNSDGGLIHFFRKLVGL